MERSQSNDQSRAYQTRKMVLQKKFRTIQAEVAAETKSFGSQKSMKTIGAEGIANLRQQPDAIQVR